MCWLCSYQSSKLGIKLNLFIVKNIGYMDLQCISTQASDYLLMKEPAAQHGTKEDIFMHIGSHMLHPRVRTAVILRQLLEFASLLQSNMVVRDGDMCTVDKGNAELFLKVINQIMGLYKVDPQVMLFSDEMSAEPENDGAA